MAEGLDGVYRIHATSTINWITNSGLTTTVNSDGRGVIVDRDGNGTVDGGDVRVTPTTLDGGTYATLDAVGDTVVLLWNDSAWQIIGGNGYAVT